MPDAYRPKVHPDQYKKIRKQLKEALRLLKLIADPDVCQIDGMGWCVEHGARPCPHAEARAFLAGHRPAEPDAGDSTRQEEA